MHADASNAVGPMPAHYMRFQHALDKSVPSMMPTREPKRVIDKINRRRGERGDAK